jgi:hypothetical protein
MSDKPKRPLSVWASLVSAHIKAGGKFPKKGTEDYDVLKKKMDAQKASKPAAAAPAAAAPAAAPAAAAAPKVRKPRVKKATGVPMPVTDAAIAPDIAVLPAAKAIKKPRLKKVAASKIDVTDTDKMDNPAQTALELREKMDDKAVTNDMLAAKNLPKINKKMVKPDLVKDLSEKKGMSATIPLARISGTQNIRIPFTERLLPSISANPV